MSSEPAVDINVCSGPLMAHACRFYPGMDVVKSIQEAVGAIAASCASSGGNCTSIGNGIAIVVISCVGSVSSLTLRMAYATSATATPYRYWNNEPLEIVSLVGTISVTTTNGTSTSTTTNIGTSPSVQEDNNHISKQEQSNGTDYDVSFHLHMSVSDENGTVYGGHFVNGTVHTTMEIIFGTIQKVHFQRIHDNNTGYRELVVTSSSS